MPEPIVRPPDSVSHARAKPSKAWPLKVASLTRELVHVEERSPLLRVIRRPTLEGGDDAIPNSGEFRTIIGFEIPTLVRLAVPGEGGDPRVLLAGPVLIGLRYAESFLDAPPIPWEIVTILGPPQVHHPNVHGGGGLCLGSPPAGIGMESILHLTFAALVLASHNTVEWEGLNSDAASYVRDHADRFPIVETGLFEAPPEAMRRPIPDEWLEAENSSDDNRAGEVA